MSRICSDRPHPVLGCCTLWPNELGFFSERFSSPVGNKAGLFGNPQSRTWSFGVNHSSIGDSWPIAFSGYPKGPRVGCETRCPKHTASNVPAETLSRTRVSREPHGHRQRRSLDGAASSRTRYTLPMGMRLLRRFPADSSLPGQMPAQGPSCKTLPKTLISTPISAMIPAASVPYNPGRQLQSATARSIVLGEPELDHENWTDHHAAEILLN